MIDEEKVKTLDLRGIPCPLSWARARVVLDEMPRGARLALLVDEGRALRDLPRAAESLGYAVDPPTPIGTGYRMVVTV